jgi:predicted metal-binding protein
MDMETVLSDLVRDALALNATHASIAEVAEIKFNKDFRTLCEQNSCGSYNKNWMCPPAVGDFNDLKERALGFKQGLLFQTVHPIERPLDWKCMLEGGGCHTKLFRKILECMENNYNFKEILPLNAGPCTYCKKCSYLVGEKCRFPDKAVSSVEANGIDVMALVKASGIPYNNGKNTVSFVALILFNC